MNSRQQHIRDVFEKTNYRNQLVWLNAGNQTGSIQIEICEKILTEFPEEEITALEIGSAYGGGVEFMAKFFYGRGRAYGYDTFIGHPKDLADNQKDLEAYCMDFWYEQGKRIKELAKDRLDYNYQRKILDKQMLSNAVLVNGRIDEHSFDDIKKIHFAMFDLDLIKPTRIAYETIKDKFVSGAYAMFHDSLPPDHIPNIHKFVYDEVLKDGRWQNINDKWDEAETIAGLVTILKRRLF